MDRADGLAIMMLAVDSNEPRLFGFDMTAGMTVTSDWTDAAEESVAKSG